MKLRTDVLKRHDGASVLCVGKELACGPDEASGDPKVIYDAAAAHALLQAMAELDDGYNKAMDYARERAAELMRQWGFEQEKADV